MSNLKETMMQEIQKNSGKCEIPWTRKKYLDEEFAELSVSELNLNEKARKDLKMNKNDTIVAIEEVENMSNKKEKNAIIERREIVYIKRSKIPLFGDYARIYPPVNEDGSWNIINLIFGGKKNILKLVFWAILIGLVLLGFHEVFSQDTALRNLPCVAECLKGLAG